MKYCQKIYELQFSALENLYQKGYVQVRILSSPSLNVALFYDIGNKNKHTDMYEELDTLLAGCVSQV
jgi:hypothetical protein